MAKKKLADYQAKRDFKKTSEPRGKAKIRAAEYPALSSRSMMPRDSTTTCVSSMMASSSPGQ